MKVGIEQKEKQFEPIKLVITIESEQELCSLWHRFNLSSNNVNNNSDGLKYKAEGDYQLFNELDNIVESLNLTK